MKVYRKQVGNEQQLLDLQLAERKETSQAYTDDKMKAFASLGMLSSGIAHDFNNLLSVILGNISLANRHISSPEQLQIYLSRIEQASRNASSLCEQMFTYTGRNTTPNQHVHLPTLVKDMTRLLDVVLCQHVSIVYDIEDHIPLIRADATQLQQIFMNLITNANEALRDKEEGRITLRIQCVSMDHKVQSLSGDIIHHGEHVRIEVIDNGCGMDEATQAKIFEPMFTTKPAGHGFGLSTTLDIIHRHSGVIQLSSELGKGSVFIVAFPIVDQQTHQDDEMKQEYDALEKFQPSGRILLVDDEEVVLEIMQVMLEDLGYRCIVAQHGADAVEKYQHHQDDIDMVIMDFSMPNMGGKDCVEALKRINPDIKIIVSSGYCEEDIQSQLKGLSVAGFLDKPCNLRQLYAAIKDVHHGV